MNGALHEGHHFDQARLIFSVVRYRRDIGGLSRDPCRNGAELGRYRAVVSDQRRNLAVGIDGLERRLASCAAPTSICSVSYASPASSDKMWMPIAQ